MPSVPPLRDLGPLGEPAFARLVEEMNVVADLDAALSLLEWDRATTMPPRGAEARGRQLSTLRLTIHERLSDPRWGDRLHAASAAVGVRYAGLHVPVAVPVDADRTVRDAAASIERTRRTVREAVVVPSDLVAAESAATTRAHATWLDAREAGPERPYLQALAEVVRLKREEADALGWTDHRYDALHDTFEPGSTTASVRAAFEVVAGAARNAMDRALGSDVHVDGALLRRRTGVADQERFVRGLVRDLGYDFDAGALGVTVHPFCQSIAPGDVRIATRYRADNLATALFGTVHEAGHGLYEQGIHLAGLPSPVSTFASLAVHESQSRLYENHVARSHAFWRGRWTHLLEAFPGTFDDVDVDTFHMHVGRVAPSLVRVEADEVSYPLHVVMRTELEIALIGGTLDVADLPSAWNEASAKWLGIVPDDATSGHLQDIHWSMGAFGYFPTYVLGSMAAAQFWESIDDALGGADADMAEGRYDGILSWLREHVHGRGAMEWPSTLVRSATGYDLEPSAFVRHLEARVAQVYGVTSGIDPRS